MLFDHAPETWPVAYSKPSMGSALQGRAGFQSYAAVTTISVEMLPALMPLVLGMK